MARYREVERMTAPDGVEAAFAEVASSDADARITPAPSERRIDPRRIMPVTADAGRA